MCEKLKPCPFCDGESIKKEMKSFRDVYGVMRIMFFKCQNPECSAIVSFDNDKANNFYTPENAIEAWNRRANDET